MGPQESSTHLPHVNGNLTTLPDDLRCILLYRPVTEDLQHSTGWEGLRRFVIAYIISWVHVSVAQDSSPSTPSDAIPPSASAASCRTIGSSSESSSRDKREGMECGEQS